jgi:ABC-type branched-subunit amino acid transport system substrate-binding protein
VALSGTFKETRFADLLQFYSVSKQTAAVSVRLGSSERLDGVFYFADGDLVGASLLGVHGRDAVRRALRLRDGSFTIEAGVGPRDPVEREKLGEVVMEEIVRLDEEDRAAPSAAGDGARFSGAVAEGAGWWSGPSAAIGSPASAPVVSAGQASPASATAQPQAGRRSSAPASPPPIAPAVAQASAAGAPGAEPRPPPVPGGAPPRRTPPASPPQRPPPRRALGTWSLVAVAAVLAGVLGAGAWIVLNRPAPSGAPEPAPSAARARGVLDRELVLGMVASFTGSNKERGRAMRIGWETAIAEANEAGGIHGRKLRLVALDDGYDPARTLPAMKEVVETQGAFAIVGNVGTATAAVAVPYCAEKDAVFFGALSGADLLRKTPPDRLVFNYRAGLSREAAAAVRYLVEVRRTPPQRIALLSQDDDFGASGRRGAMKQLATYSVPEAEVLSLTYPRNTADVRDAVAKLKDRAKDVDAVVMTATYKPAATFVRKTKDAGLDVFYTTVSADSNGLAEELVESGQRYTERVLLTQVVPVPTSGASTLIRYRQSLEKHAAGEKPGSTSLEAWIGAQIFLEALRRAGRDLDTAKLAQSLESIRDWDLGIGGAITFGPNDHQGSEMVWGWLLQPDGSYRQVELE